MNSESEMIPGWLLEEYVPKAGVDERALDVGCDLGDHSAFLSERGFSTLGIDYSEISIDLAQKRQLGVATLSFRCVDFLALRENFHFILMHCVLPANDDEALAMLRHAKKSLYPGASLLLIEWAPQMLKAWGLEGEAGGRSLETLVEMLGEWAQGEAKTVAGVLENLDDSRRSNDGNAYLNVVQLTMPN